MCEEKGKEKMAPVFFRWLLKKDGFSGEGREGGLGFYQEERIYLHFHIIT